jgi:dihydrofolate synthase/folylpolyglutamate synthase
MKSDYQQTLDYLFAQLPMFSRLGKAAIKNDLDNIKALCAALGEPHEQFPSVHIAGTNGKGSVSHMLAAALQQAGYNTGLYTSPHLTDFRERIRINGRPVSREWVVGFVDEHRELIERIQPSFFEITVAMAFAAFAAEEVDIAVIETGLGGRLDSTNIINPLLSVITNISLDHTDLLGTTLPEIAAEKAGIIKPKVPVVIGMHQEETARVFFEHALRQQSTIYYADSIWELVRTGRAADHQRYKAVHNGRREMYDLATDMTGDYQAQNIRTVLAAAEILEQRGTIQLPLSAVIAALGHVKKTTGIRGRWETLQQRPFIVSDVAHNPAGIEEVMRQWAGVKAEKKHILTGFVRDKDVAAALALFPTDAIYHFTQAQIPRALPVDELQTIAGSLSLQGKTYSSVQEALSAVLRELGEDDALLITGSFFIAGEAIQVLSSLQEAAEDPQ